MEVPCILFTLRVLVFISCLCHLLLFRLHCFVLDVRRWEYMHSPPENSKEAEILEVLRHPKDWVH